MKAIDKLIDLLPIPLLVALAAIGASAWLLKTLREKGGWRPILGSRAFLAVVAVVLVGLGAYYWVESADPFERPFAAGQQGILVAPFDGDTTGAVMRQASEAISARAADDASLAQVAVRPLVEPIIEGDIRRRLERARAMGLVTGSVVSEKAIWFRVYWRDRPTLRMLVTSFPDTAVFEDRLMEALRATPSGPPAAAAIAPGARQLALVIGNNTYPKATSLTYGVSDASAVAAEFRRRGIDVELLTDVTQDQMQGGVNDIARRAPAGSVIYFYYSGHGIAKPNSSYLIATDHDMSGGGPRGLTVETLTTQLGHSAAAQVFVLLDTNVGRLDSLVSTRVSVIAAGRANEFAMEDPEVKGGVFTHFLLKGMRDQTTQDGSIPFEALATQVAREVQTRTDGEMHPFALAFGEKRFFPAARR